MNLVERIALRLSCKPNDQNQTSRSFNIGHLLMSNLKRYGSAAQDVKCYRTDNASSRLDSQNERLESLRY
jgi:hypothetical protein